jgi:hypothetical protein
LAYWPRRHPNLSGRFHHTFRSHPDFPLRQEGGAVCQTLVAGNGATLADGPVSERLLLPTGL